MLAGHKLEIHAERDRKLEAPNSSARVTGSKPREELATRHPDVGQPFKWIVSGLPTNCPLAGSRQTRLGRGMNFSFNVKISTAELVVRISDDGKGMDEHVLRDKGRSGHWGLPGMRERAKLVGGQMEIWSEPDSGTEIELRIPASIAYGTSAKGQSRERTA